ncbi:uncharacterized protein LOC129573093 [Sitodiplosis mosellana]|uniref:uncharacterized protein LOC129573093 n=1 Tax=Sitodiplosis mosellana TaxID=263140 RepID=UPI002443AD6F|nr:uncharacterized protein LOC129573093 [Sitodiplosis mosellana]
MGNKVMLRALCDSGCQINLVSSDTAQRLRLKKAYSQLQILGLGGIQEAKGKVELQLESPFNAQVNVSVECYVTTRLLGILPQSAVDVEEWPDIKKLKLADEGFHLPGQVDLILGAEFYSHIVKNGVRHFKDGPTAQNTSFGWIVFGQIGLPKCHIAVANPLIADDEVMKLLTRFWNLESVPTRHFQTEEEQKCEDIFTKTTTRDHTGRFCARIPMIDDPPEVIGSRLLALGRLRQMHKRFDRDPSLRENYVKFLAEYESLGHMELVPKRERVYKSAVYIPHHAAGTSKFRVVFDGSCKNKGSPSPNDIQLNGERLQPDLTTIIMRFRFGKIALCADIAKMYRQVRVPEDQRDSQRILWSDSPDDPVREYRLCTQTYGMKSAAYVCIRTLFECANIGENDHPKAAKVVRTSFYVDDMLHSEPDLESATHVYHELNEMLGSCQMQLAKWITNDPQMHDIMQANGGEPLLELDKEQTNAVLGMHWNPIKDEFQFIIKTPPSDEKPTKRRIASDIARLYDPNGLLAPVIIQGRIILQRVWRQKLGWDEEIEDDADEELYIASDWDAFRRDLPAVEKIRIPRWIKMQPNAKTQLHGFSDASDDAYGISFYIRVETTKREIDTRLVFSKIRVSPTTKATVPKLELSAAHLMAKMLSSVVETHDVTMNDCYLWSDSMIVLHWIRKSPAKLDVFQANRVAEIQELTEGAAWAHVATKDNPADLCSRGVSPSKLIDAKLWWHGPSWLRTPQPSWPESKLNLSSHDAKVVESATKKAKPVIGFAHAEPEQTVTKTVRLGGELIDIGLHQAISHWGRLARVTAYVLRFIHNIRSKSNRLTGAISSDEMIDAETVWIRYSQKTFFAKEIVDCQNRKPLDKSSPLHKLSPFIDNKGVLRLSGRLKHSGMPYDSIHPMVLTNKCIIARRLVDHAHNVTLHGGIQLTQQYLRNKYWIIGLRTLVKSVVNRWLPCVRQRRENAEQLMGQLPPSRVRPGRAFAHTSVDYLGPILVKRYNATRAKIVDKGYVSVFVCMKTRAVHLELVSSLTTEAFLAAYSRFTHRRGKVEEMWSDNGTTFQGASNEMEKINKDWKDAAESELFRQNATRWNFLPPHAPHMGGIHEAAVKSAKHHLRRVIGNQQLTSNWPRC